MGADQVSVDSVAGPGSLAKPTIVTHAPKPVSSETSADYFRGFAIARRRREPVHVRLPALDAQTQNAVIEAIEKIVSFRELEKGWDGDRAFPLTDDACRMAIWLVVNVTSTEAPRPQLVPLADGGIQAEWHVFGNDLEVEISPTGDLSILATTSLDEDVIDVDVPPALVDGYISQIRRFLGRLARVLRENK